MHSIIILCKYILCLFFFCGGHKKSFFLCPPQISKLTNMYHTCSKINSCNSQHRDQTNWYDVLWSSLHVIVRVSQWHSRMSPECRNPTTQVVMPSDDQWSVIIRSVIIRGHYNLDHWSAADIHIFSSSSTACASHMQDVACVILIIPSLHWIIH